MKFPQQQIISFSQRISLLQGSNVLNFILLSSKNTLLQKQ